MLQRLARFLELAVAYLTPDVVGPERFERHAIAAQLVGDDHSGQAILLEQLTEEPISSRLIPARLKQNAEGLIVGNGRALQPVS